MLLKSQGSPRVLLVIGCLVQLFVILVWQHMPLHMPLSHAPTIDRTTQTASPAPANPETFPEPPYNAAEPVTPDPLHPFAPETRTGTAETAGMVGTVGTVETAGTATAGIGMPGTGTADTRGTTTPGLTRSGPVLRGSWIVIIVGRKYI